LIACKLQIQGFSKAIAIWGSEGLTLIRVSGIGEALCAGAYSGRSDMLVVNEIFQSVQGESSYAGWPCLFVRLTGCNLRCAYCDTRHAYDEGHEMSVVDIIHRLQPFSCPLVEITGGEPLIQSETPELIQKLLDEGWQVLVETNGSIDIACVDPRCVRIVDFKCPSSFESNSNDYKNIERLSPKDEVKFVIGDREDYEFARALAARVQSSGSAAKVPIHFSPVSERLPPRVLVQWILEDRLQVRLNLQLHKFIWGPDERGV
jgi:7-carboxy-7-deazaguanine synthase